MKRKYAEMYYSVHNTDKGWVWKIYFNYSDKKPAVTSLENEDEDDKYCLSETAARMDAIHAIQDHYN
jgi:hypothetical protein